MNWIILVWLTLNPLTDFDKAVNGKEIWHVYTTTSTSDFTQKWNSLDGDARKSARVFSGNECVPVLALEPKKEPEAGHLMPTLAFPATCQFRFQELKQNSTIYVYPIGN